MIPTCRHILQPITIPLPPHNNLFRTISKAIDVKVGEGKKYTLPQGSICLMPFCAMHRDPSIFENSDMFMPQCWESTTDEQKVAWISFSLGRRNCNGQLLANIKMELVLARLISEYDWNIVDEGHAKYSFTLKTIGTMLQATRISQ